MKELNLTEIIKYIGGKVNNIPKDVFVKGISTDTREDLKGKLYIALKGDNFDGHSFIEQAFEKGCVAAVVSDVIDLKEKCLIKVDDTKKALLKITEYYKSLFNIKVIGVTGSVGKTTTKDMIAAVANVGFNVLKTDQNLNNEIGVSKTILSLEEDINVAVIEMGMCNFGEISEVTKIIRPNIGVVTNIGVSHIEKLGSRENIFKAKMEIIDGMENGGLLILNKDDDFLSNYNNKNFRIKSYSIKNKYADVFAKNIYYDEMKTNFELIDGENKLNVELPCLGEHNVYNAMVAYIVGKELNIPNKQILAGLKAYIPSGMRQKVVNFNEAKIIEDCYNASPDSMRAAIKTLSQMNVSGKKIMVISDMLELGEISKKEHYNIGVAIGKADINILCCIGDMATQYLAGAINEGMKNNVDVLFFNEKSQLAKWLKNNITTGDVAWFKASRGMKLEEVIEQIY